MTFDRLAEMMYVDLPVRLRQRLPILGIVLADGVYLTAWPLWAVLAPAAVLAFGFSVGGWHWLPHNIWDGGISAHPAVAFMQMLPLLVIAVAVGALGASLGLALVAGYALGDLLISSATYAPYFHRFGLGWWLGHVITAQLVTYLVFLLLAVLPILVSRLLTASVPGLRLSTGPLKAPLRALVAAAILALLAYLWTMMAPMAVRPLWLWLNIPATPVTVQYFISVANPMLPLVAGGSSLVRALVEALANHDEHAKRNAALIAAAYRQALARCRGSRFSAWFGAIAGAVAVTLLLAGMTIHLWPTGVLVFGTTLALFIVYRIILPRHAGWQAWAGFALRVPLIARWLVVIFGAYAIGRAVLATPGMAVWQNPETGAFGAELFAAVIGLALLLSLFPTLGKSAVRPAPASSTSTRGLLLVPMMIGATALLMHSAPAFASCLDPNCCLVNNKTGGGLAQGLVGMFSLLILWLDPEALVALAAEQMFGELGGVAIEIGAAAKEISMSTKLKSILSEGWRFFTSGGGWKLTIKRGWKQFRRAFADRLRKFIGSNELPKTLVKKGLARYAKENVKDTTRGSGDSTP